ncbi:WD repeat-containing protein 64 isoform X1 [Octopus bimaculoides]|uniref:WD repeat-containing protein 64 isoform X1 n=1 Tax=Octopus bimaculoides TaxID=37653 RepID=UPI0022E8E61E|nr:WD repeat-containing protein 64 isoform X1 [Octopus bimaculoides]
MPQAKLRRPYTNNSFRKQLEKFRTFIKDVTYSGCELTSEYRRQLIAENLPYDKFSEKLRLLFGQDIKSQEIKVLYRKIISNPEAAVDWSEVFSIFNSNSQRFNGADEGSSVFDVSKKRRVGNAAGNCRKRDTLQSIHYSDGLDCYITASLKGVVTVWNSQLRLQHSINIHEPSWVTGCIYLPNLRRVAICTERSLCIWDSKGKSQHPICIRPFDNTPQCLTLALLQDENTTQDSLLIGDDQGYISILTINTDEVMMNLTEDKAGQASKMVISPASLTKPMRRRRFHDDWVVKIRYLPELRCFVSCSPSSLYSLVVEPIEKIWNNEMVEPVSIPKGVNAFGYCKSAQILATGGVDKIIRIWHPHMFAHPTGKLIGHLFTVSDICCNERDQHIISLSTARVIRVWDIHAFTSLQIFSGSEQHRQGARITCMLYDDEYERLLTGSDVFDSWPLSRTVQDTMQIPQSHDRPINQVLYNSELNQVITVCNESVLKVWEFETGDLVYQIANAHGLNIEITSLAVEDSGYRLASGAFDGSLLIWDIGSGKWCKRMPCVASSKSMSVLTMKYFMKSSERLIIALGWNNKVKIILDSSDSNQLLILKEVSQELLDIFDHKHLIKILSTSNNTQIPNNQISVEQSYQTTHDLNSPEMSKHQTSYPENSIEISCLSLLSPDVIVLGYNNGNCVIWDIVSTNVKAILSIQHVKDSESPYRQNKEDTRVNMIKILNYKKKRSDRKHSMKLTIANKLHKRRMTIGPRNSMFQFRGSKNSHQIMGDTRKFSANISPEERREENYTEEFTNVSTQDILRPRSKQYNFNNGRNQITSDVKAPLLICNSDPVIAVIYQDDCIRFWNAKGQLLTKLKPLVKHSSNSLTCICHDNDCTILIAGDKIGYLTLWDIGKFLQQSNSEEKAPIIQEVRWRAHLSAVISLSYISTSNSIISGSTDASVRVWWGTGGRFVGFFGQPRPFVFPVSEESSRYSCLPYDINEQPTKIATEKVERMFRGNAQNLEYPLVFNNERWKHSWRQNDKSEEAALTSDEFGHPAEKFFTALVKPKAYKHHLKTLIRGEKGADAVFRSLPLYRLETPKVPRTPELTRTTYEDKCKNMYTTRYMKRTSKGRCSRRSIDVRGFRQVTTNYLPSIRKLSRVSFDVPSHSSNIFS